MNRLAMVLLVCALAVVNISFLQHVVKAEEASYKIPVNEDGIEAVTLELKSGDIAVVYILKESKDSIYVQNLSSSMEASMPRSKILKIRKPTVREVEKVKARWGNAMQNASPGAETKK